MFASAMKGVPVVVPRVEGINIWIGDGPRRLQQEARRLGVDEAVDPRDRIGSRGADDSAGSRVGRELVDHSPSAAEHRLLVDLIGDAEARTESVRIGAGIKIAAAVGRVSHAAQVAARLGVHFAGIELAQTAVGLPHRRGQVLSQTIIHSQFPGNFPGVLRERTRIAPCPDDSPPGGFGWWSIIPQQETGVAKVPYHNR